MMKLGMINNQPNKESLAYVKGLGLSFIEMCNNNNEETVYILFSYFYIPNFLILIYILGN